MPKRSDANQQQIMDAFRECGWWCWDTHTLGKGGVDMVIARPDGILFLVEVKANDKAKFTQREIEFRQKCLAPILCITSREQVNEMDYHWKAGL